MGGGSQLSVMRQLGLTDKDFHDAHGNLKQLSDLMQLMRSRMQAKHLSKGQVFEDMHQFFGTTGQETALILEKNANAIKDLNNQVANADKMKGGGYVQWLAKNNMKTATNQVNLFKQAWNAFGIATANTILPTITGMVKGLDGLLLDINKMGPTAKTITAWAAVGVAGIGPLAFAISGIIKTINALKATSNFFNRPVGGNYSESMDKTAASVSKSYDQMTSSAMQYAKVQADIGGETYKASPRDTNTNVGEITKNNAFEYDVTDGNASRMAQKATPFQRFESRFHGKSTSGTSFGKIADNAHLAQDAGKYSTTLGKVGGITDIASKGLGLLGIASSGLGLLDMNKHNSGQKVGGATGAVAGGALGTMLDPFTFGMGSVIGTTVGQKIGTDIGPAIGKEFHKNFGQPDNVATHHTTQVETQMKLINQKALDEQVMKGYGKGSSEYKKYAKNISDINKQLYRDQSSQANSAYHKETEAANKSYNQHKDDLKWLLDKNLISHTQYYQKLRSLEQNHSHQLSEANATRKSATKRSLIEETAEYNKFYKGLSKMNTAQVANVLKQNAKQKDTQIKNAKEMYKSTVSSDKAAEKETIKNLKEFGLQNTKQGKKEIREAKSKYASEQKGAERLKDRQIKAATDASNHVISEAEKSHSGIRKQIDMTTGEMKNAGWDFSHRHWLLGIEATFKNIGKSIHNADASAQKKTRNTKGLGVAGTYAAHALGRQVGTNETALVNENGEESIYNARRGEFSILQGNAGLVNLSADDNVLTAQQTKQLLNTHIRKRNLKGYAKGMGGTINVKVSVKSLRSAITATKHGMLQVERLIERGYRSTNKSAMKQMALLNRSSAKSWKAISNDTSKETRALSKDLGKEYKGIKDSVFKLIGNMSDDSLKQFTSMRDSLLKLTSTMSSDMEKEFKDLVSNLNSILEDLPKDAKASMESTVNALNQGIAGIDSTLKQFGGNGEVLKPFHYASGSDGKLDSDQIAMVNDATSGPTQEAIVRDSQIYLPKYRNQLMKLNKGDAVLNGTQTQRLINNYQTVNHYASGSGVKDSTLEKLAGANSKSPNAAFNNEFTNRAKPEGPTLERGLTSGIVNAIKGVGQRWSGAMWNLIENTISGGGGSGSLGAFLKYAERIGMGKRYVMGATGPDAFDCSGLIYTALKHFGITIGRNTVAEQNDPRVHFLGKNINKAQVGDLAIFGHGGGADGHVGIISNIAKGLMMNATPPSGRISSIAAAEPYVPGGLAGYYHVSGLSSDSNSKKNKNSGMLNKLVKSELGKKALKWISDNLGETDMGGGAGGDSPLPTGSRKHWLAQAGISPSDFGAANYIINHESGWNPHATNPDGGAYGLPQSLPGSKMASAGADWRNNPITQLKWMKGYVKGRYGGFQQAQAYWESHHNYANGGWANQPSTFGEVPGQPEVAINPRRDSADRLILEAIEARNKVTGNPFAKYFKAEYLKSKSNKLAQNVHDMVMGKNKRSPQPRPAVNININPTININGGHYNEHELAHLIEEKLQQLAYRTYSKVHLNADA